MLSKAVGRGGAAAGGGGEGAKAESKNAAADDNAGKLSTKETATKHRRRAPRGGLGCITAQPESSPSPEPKYQKPAVFLDATSQFVGLGFDPFR